MDFQEIKTVLDELRTSVGNFSGSVKSLETRFDNFEVKKARPNSGGGGGVSLAQKVLDSTEFHGFQGHGRGKVVIPFNDLTMKSVLASDVGYASGTILTDRVVGIVPEARRQLRLRSLLTVYPASSGVVDYVKISTPPTKSSPVQEGELKPEVSMGFTAASTTIRTLASWIACSSQVLQDMASLKSAIDGALLYQAGLEEERQIIFGDDSGQNLCGLAHQAQPWNISLLDAGDGYEYSDIIGGACSMIAAADEPAADFVVLHPDDFWKIRLCRDSTGQYVYGSPNQPAPSSLFGLTVVPSTVMGKGYFLVGSSAPTCCAIFEKLGLIVEVSTEHSDFFIRNLIAIRCEERVALVTFRPNAYVYGAFSQSPA